MVDLSHVEILRICLYFSSQTLDVEDLNLPFRRTPCLWYVENMA